MDQPLEYSPAVFSVLHAVGRFSWFCTMNAGIRGEDNLRLPGGYLLASNHGNHVDPLVLGAFCDRSIDWMTRKEFFQYRALSWLIRRLGGFCVNRQGVPVSAIRTAMARLRAGRIVGVFPEGGVARGSESVCRGGAMKQGVCLLACRTGAPIIPCVIVGSHKLSGLRPWLPYRRARTWIAFGTPLYPPAQMPNRKSARRAMALELQKRFRELYEQLIADFEIEPADWG